DPLWQALEARVRRMLAQGRPAPTGEPLAVESSAWTTGPGTDGGFSLVHLTIGETYLQRDPEEANLLGVWRRRGDADERVVTLTGEGLKRVVPLAVGDFGSPAGEQLIALLRSTSRDDLAVIAFGVGTGARRIRGLPIIGY